MDKRKILIIDDEKDFSNMVKLNLESTGKYDVAIETDSRSGLFAVLHHRPDLILLDVIMPKKEGPEIAMEIRRDPSLKEIPVVFLTATVTQKEVDEENGVIGGHPFVAKPSSLDILLGAIERNLLSV